MESTCSLLSALGIAAKARALLFGVPMITEALAGQKKPYLVVAPEDNAKNSEKRLCDKCSFYGVRLVHVDVSGEALAHAVGKHSHLAAVAVTDENLARLIEGKLPQSSEANGI